MRLSRRQFVQALSAAAAAGLPLTPRALAADTAAVSVMFRITAHATGGSDKAEVILQTTFRR